MFNIVEHTIKMNNCQLKFIYLFLFIIVRKVSSRFFIVHYL